MSEIQQYRSASLTVLIIISCMFFFSTCINNSNTKTESAATAASSKYSLFAGSSSCSNCHKDIYESHIQTAHFRTSETASAKTIKGSFAPGQNTFTYKSGAFVEMKSEGGNFFQAAFSSMGVEKIRQRFDIVTGSGTKGQTYLSWQGDSLYQLPISYFTNASYWCNSPGMPNKIVFYRPITSRCLECHTTYAEKIPGSGEEPERFDKGRMILGVDCEKCHGPAAKHVEFQMANPTDSIAKFILNPARFSRTQSLDLCALCHGGRLKKKTEPFSFTAGDNLEDHFLADAISKDIDVHGNQYGLLASSKCFQVSKTMTCISCHNVHENEQGRKEIFSQRCMSCHNSDHKGDVVCKMTSSMGSSINSNCTSCHMPQLPSKAIAVLLQGSDTSTPATMHTHLIKNYPEETARILAYLKNKPTTKTSTQKISKGK